MAYNLSYISGNGGAARQRSPASLRRSKRHTSIPAIRTCRSMTSSAKEAVARRFSALPEMKSRPRLLSIFYRDHHQIVLADLQRRLQEQHDIVARYHFSLLSSVLQGGMMSGQLTKELRGAESEFAACVQGFLKDILPELRSRRESKELTKLAVQFSAILSLFLLDSRRCLSIQMLAKEASSQLIDAESKQDLCNSDTCESLLSPNSATETAQLTPSPVRRKITEIETAQNTIENTIAVFFSSAQDPDDTRILAVKRKKRRYYSNFLSPVICCGRKTIYA